MAATKPVPGPSRLKALSNTRAFLNNRALFMYDLWDRYGDVCRFQLGVFDVYFINRPEWIKEALQDHKNFPKTPAIRSLRFVLGDGLLLSGGEVHRRQRRLMQPAFHPSRIALYCDTMVERTRALCARWRDKEEVVINREMSGLTLDIVSRTMFNSDVENLTERVSRAINAILPMADTIAEPTGMLRRFLPLPRTLRFRRGNKELNAIIYEIIAEGRASGQDRGDLLSMLLLAQDDEGDGTGMSDKQLRDEALTIFLAGHETTAVALTWIFYLLSRNPEVANRLHREVVEVIGRRSPCAEDVASLSYARMVISEALRLYPPAYLIDRISENDWEIGEHVIPAGKYVFLSQYTMHRHPEFWPDPERFDPERWTPEAMETRPKFAYFPFGGGPRVCIGEQFAWTELILVVATIVQSWEVFCVDEQEASIGSAITLRPAEDIRLRLARREGALAPLSKAK